MIDFFMIDDTHGLNVQIDDENRLIDSETGQTYKSIYGNENADNQLPINIKANDVLTNSSIKVSLYKRNTTYNLNSDGELEYTDVSYSQVDLQDYVSTDLGISENNEYLVTNNVLEDDGTENTNMEFLLDLNNNLQSGGYKLQFKLYYNDICLNTIDKYFVITDLMKISE